LTGLTAVMAAIGPQLLQHEGHAALGALVRVTTAPLAAIVRLADKRVVPLADPSRNQT
jgi:hypothetical protein